jgi:hypothetical protein
MFTNDNGIHFQFSAALKIVTIIENAKFTTDINNIPYNPSIM